MGNGIGTAGTVAGVEAIYATVAALAALDAEDATLAAAGSSAMAGDGVDVLQRAYEIRLERMGLEKKLEAQAAARKARSVAEAMDLQHAMLPPDAPLHERSYANMSAVEEIAGILTISSGAASALVDQSRQVCALPPVMDALSTGTMSWQQARIFVDETEALDHPAAAALVGHFLDPDAPNPARGCPAPELVPARLRARLRGWRERHHPESIEKRHRKSFADRRVEFTPDRDGMAWISAYLRADQALAINNDLAATARILQGPNETRTLTQLKADDFARRLLTNRTTHASAPDPAAGSLHGEGDPAEDDPVGMAILVGSDESLADLGVSDEPATEFSTFAGDNDSNRPATATESATGTTPDQAEPVVSRTTPDQTKPVVNRTSTDACGQVPAGPEPDAAKLPTPRADVLVIIPFLPLLGLTDEPAELDGYGPIPASMARELLAGGAESFRRVLVDPRDGTPLEIGRTSYRLTKAMKKHSNSGTANASSPAATTTPSTTTPTTSKPGNTAEPQESATSHNSAQNTTGSNTTAAGNPPPPPNTSHPAGPHPPAATTRPNNPTANHLSCRTGWAASNPYQHQHQRPAL